MPSSFSHFLSRGHGANNPAPLLPMKRTVNLVAPNRLRITTDRVTYEYTIQVWFAGSGVHRIINLYRTDGGAAYTITISPFINPRNAVWRCDCPAATHRGGQCKHVLALKAGLRSVGCKV